MTVQGPVPSRPHRSLAVAVLAVATLVGGVVVAVSDRAVATSTASADAGRPPVSMPTARVVAAGAVTPWDEPLRLAVADGTLTGISVTDPDGAGVPGTLTPTGWTSARTLVPAARYTASLTVRDADDVPHVLALTARTTPADRIVTAALSPGDDAVVGVGKPIAVTLDRAVEDDASRAALLDRLSVRARPAAPGAWRWMDDRTVHYRPAAFWAPGTTVDVRVDLHRLGLPDGSWGSGIRTSRFTVGSALISTVDVEAKTMTVRRDGAVVRVMKASMGRPGFATRNGTFIVLEKHRRKTMDSATLDLPPGSEAYRTDVEHAVRITNSGTFTHGAPWSVADQGVRNVSHGCINLSPADAAWYFEQARRGDVVVVTGSTEGPTSSDAGSRDWNMSFEDWQRPT